MPNIDGIQRLFRKLGNQVLSGHIGQSVFMIKMQIHHPVSVAQVIGIGGKIAR